MKKSVGFIKILSTALATLLMFTVVFCFILIEPAVKIKSFDNLSSQKLQPFANHLSVFDSENALITESITKRIDVGFNQLPKHTIDAFVAIEDARFFQHSGIDYYRIGGATVKNFKTASFKEGASTITQQLIKNTHLSNDKNIKRKLNEVRIAIDAERHYSKNEIFEMYVNAIYFGNGLYGIGAAANGYFKKTVPQLTLNESALLAAIINNPSKYNPVTNADKANQRRRLVLSQMKKYGKISEEVYSKYLNCDIFVNDVLFEQYANYVVNEACEVLGISRSEFFDGNFSVKTYFDSDLQNKVNKVIRGYKFSEDSKGLAVSDNSFIQAIVMTTSGKIIANASNTNQNLSEVYRQPGSVIKPAIAYAPAFEKKLVSPITPILDEEISFDGYTPRNHNEKNLGWISVAESLKLSQNVTAVKLMDMSGIDYSKTVANRLGYEFAKDDNHLALALGGMSKGAKLTQIANSYQAFANGGRFIKCGHIESITQNSSGINGGESGMIESKNTYNVSGKNNESILTAYNVASYAHCKLIESQPQENIIYKQNKTKNQAKVFNRYNESEYKSTVYKRTEREHQAVSKETAYFINSILTDCGREGTARRIGNAAAKTGTVGNNSGNSDAYVVAYNSEYVVAVWIGAKNGLLPNSVNGATHPCIIAKSILDYLPASDGFNKPDSVIEIELDKAEYKKNHKIVTAADNSYPKDRITGEFLVNNPPAQKTLDNKFILQMNEIDIENFVIID